MKKKKILLTGSQGFVGSIFREEFIKKYDITEVDLPDYDLSKNDSLNKGLGNSNFDAIVHLAALSSPRESFENPEKYYAVNLLGTLNLLNLAKSRNIKNFFFMSSLTVHGESNNIVNENSLMQPRHIYASSKAAAENLCHAFSVNYDLNINVMRPNLIIGASKKPPDLISATVNELFTEGSYTVFGDGNHLRDWTHVKDVVYLIDELIFYKDKKFNVFCLGDNKLSVNEIFHLINSNFKSNKRIEKPRNNSSFNLFCSNDKIISSTSWKQKISIEMMIEESMQKYGK